MPRCTTGLCHHDLHRRKARIWRFQASLDPTTRYLVDGLFKDNSFFKALLLKFRILSVSHYRIISVWQERLYIEINRWQCHRLWFVFLLNNKNQGYHTIFFLSTALCRCFVWNYSSFMTECRKSLSRKHTETRNTWKFFNIQYRNLTNAGCGWWSYSMSYW